MKRDMKAGVRDITFLTPKYTMGVLAGEISSIKNEKGRIAITIDHNEFDALMQRHFKMGQSQVKGLLKAYGHTSFRKKVYNLGPHAVLRVVKLPKKKV